MEFYDGVAAVRHTFLSPFLSPFLSRFPRSFFSPLAFLFLTALVAAGCQSGPPAQKTREQQLPDWLKLRVPKLTPDLQLEEAAALLCSSQSATLDRQARHLLGLSVGQLTTAVFMGRDQASTQEKAAAASARLLHELRATHVGIAEGSQAGGDVCIALVGARRLLHLLAPLPTRLAQDAAFPLEGKVLGDPNANVVLFATRPGGSVSRTVLEVKNGYFTQLVTPQKGAGRYTLELMIARDDNPEVAILWPFRVGEGNGGPLPPFPAVLFGDKGHGDLALSHRAEALVQRLRTEQEIRVLKVSPALLRVARSRAKALSLAAGLGHRRPNGKTPVDDLRANEPKFGFLRLAEVQAQASTLKDAWLALLRSPSHRFELVHAKATHFGATVTRGQDGAGRTLITLEILFAERTKRQR